MTRCAFWPAIPQVAVRISAAVSGLFLLAACSSDRTTAPILGDPPPQYSQSTVVHAYLIGHQDDWQFFDGNHAGAALLSGNKTILVYTTAGDAGNDSSYWKVRERAANASIDTIIPAAPWSCGRLAFGVHAIHRCTKANTVSYFLRFPDGNSGDGLGYGYGSLRRLLLGTPVTTVDTSTVYTSWSDLITTLKAIVVYEAGGLPVHLHAPEYDRDLNPGDHRDHTLTGDAAKEISLGMGWTYDLFVGYNIATRPVNLTPEEIAMKTRLMDAYNRVTIAAGLGGAGGTAFLSRTYWRPDPTSATPPTLIGIQLTPGSASLQPGNTQQFSAVGLMSNGTTAPVTVTYAATGGTITGAGLYTAGATPGGYSVIAVEPGGLADTAAVTITAAPPTLVSVTLTPTSVSLQPGNTQQFTVIGNLSDGSTSAVAVSYTATGGTITAAGVYTAGVAAGTFSVIATGPGGLADTASVTVTVPAPSLVGIELLPANATVQLGGTQQFTARGLMSDGSTTSITATFSASGGTITAAGVYTAPLSAPGTYLVIAVEPGGRADSSVVTVPQLTKLRGDDWLSYTSVSALQAANYFSWSDSRNVYSFISLMPDPVFGQVVRITQPSGQAISPRLDKSLPGPRDKVWYRWRMKYSAGWTTLGTNGNGGNYGIAEWKWNTHLGAGSLMFDVSAYRGLLDIRNASTGSNVSYTTTLLAGSAPNFGSETTEWDTAEWWEYVAYYQKQSATTARQHYWRRKLTTNGVVAPGPWSYYGFSISGATTPTVSAIALGLNKNKKTAATQYIYWGPWEVYDGAVYANPFGLTLPN